MAGYRPPYAGKTLQDGGKMVKKQTRKCESKDEVGKECVFV